MDELRLAWICLDCGLRRFVVLGEEVDVELEPCTVCGGTRWAPRLLPLLAED